LNTDISSSTLASQILTLLPEEPDAVKSRKSASTKSLAKKSESGLLESDRNANSTMLSSLFNSSKVKEIEKKYTQLSQEQDVKTHATTSTLVSRSPAKLPEETDTVKSRKNVSTKKNQQRKVRVMH
jgi:hypothetical protein